MPAFYKRMMPSSSAISALRLLLPIGLVAAVILAVDVGEVSAILLATDLTVAALALVIVQAQTVASAWRWRYTAGRLGVGIPLGRAVGEYYLAGLLNLVLPGGVAGDVVRTVRSARGRDQTRAIVRSVVLERLAGQIAFWALAAGGLAAWMLAGSGRAPEGAGLVILVVPLGVAIVAGLVGLAGRIGPPRVRRALADLWPDIGRAYVGGGALAVQAGLSLLIAASYVTVFALAAVAIGAPLPWTGVVTLIPLALLSMLLPVTVGGWGVREGTAALLWPLAGLTATAGVATAMLYGAMVLVGALPGLAVLAARRRTASGGGADRAGGDPQGASQEGREQAADDQAVTSRA